jgi:hypothetical protein
MQTASACTDDDPVFTEAVEVLRKHFRRSAEDQRFGRFGVTICVKNGVATHCEYHVDGTTKGRERAIGSV